MNIFWDTYCTCWLELSSSTRTTLVLVRMHMRQVQFDQLYGYHTAFMRSMVEHNTPNINIKHHIYALLS